MSDMHIALLGAGLIGGSFALALKDAGQALTITVYDPNAAHGENLRARGAVDRIAATVEDAVRDADLVLLASPLGTYRALAQAMAPVLKPGCIVTDVGSVKCTMAALSPLLSGARVVPGHPIAGSEKSGPETASGDLFKGRLAILSPNAATDSNALTIVETLWHAVGADVIHVPVEVHDQIYAYVSHLPHIIAFVAASYFHRVGVQVSADDAMLQQFLRIARSNPVMWTDIMLENREAFLPVLATYIALLEHFATELRAGEKTETADKAALAKAFLPRILAASLISSVSLHEQQSGVNLRPFGAGGMRDIVAPAAVTPEADTEAISHAATGVADHIDGILPLFRQLEQLLGAEDAPGLLTYVRSLTADAHTLLTPRN